MMNTFLAYLRTFTDSVILNVTLVIFNSPLFLATISTIAYAITRAYLVYIDQRSASRYLAAQVRINDLMRDLFTTTKIDRIMFFKAEKISLDQRFWQKQLFKYGVIESDNVRHRVTAIYEFQKDKLWGERFEYQELYVDTLYSEMLNKLADDGSVMLITEELKAQLLKDIYQSNGVQFSKVIKLYSNSGNKVLYYVSLASFRENFNEDAATLSAISKAVSEIRDSYSSIFNY